MIEEPLAGGDDVARFCFGWGTLIVPAGPDRFLTNLDGQELASW